MARTLLLEGPRTLRLRDEESRDLGPREIRVRALLSGISVGTELALYRGTSAFADRVFDRDLGAFVVPDAQRSPYPAPLGYELIGVVEEVGDEVEWLRPGDVVHAGVPHRDEVVLDIDVAAGMTYPLVRLLPEEPLEHGLFVSVGAVALVAIHDSRMKLGDNIAVVGLGAIGLLLVQMARLAGANRVTVVDPVAERRALALELGAAVALDPREGPDGVGARMKREDGRGADVSFETSGNTGGLHDAVSAAGLGGTVVTVGFYQGGATELRLGEEWHHNRLDMVSSMGAWGAPHRSYPAWDRLRVMRTMVGLLASGQVRVDALTLKRFPFEQAGEAYRWLDENPRGAIKVALEYGDGARP